MTSGIGVLADCDKKGVRREGLNGFCKIHRRKKHVMTGPACTYPEAWWPYDRNAKHVSSKIVRCAFSDAEMKIHH